MRFEGQKERGVQPAQVEVEVPRHNVNDLRKRAARGDKLSREEVEAIVQAERPTTTQVRPTGRSTRTGTEVNEKAHTRKHAEKWEKRNERSDGR